MRGLRGLSESPSNFFLLVSEWRLDETITREADALAIINKDVRNFQTWWNTVVVPLSLRELRHISRMYFNNALRNFNLYPHVF